ncbi:MAG TPA: serine hydrolase domain-containing protein [Vicinamibacterales bacterium]|nr:serine hydrolase domain-containing protein [Vicinamibacterales bacterium]
MKARWEIWLAVAALSVGLLLLAVLGLWGYMSLTATPLHPDPDDVPSVSGVAPSRRWAAAAERGRRIARAALAEQNLPGLSIAVGFGDDVVWAEGFGWADLESQVPVGPDTAFRIGTLSVVLTSAAVGVLVEEGRLELDEDIRTYVPEFPKTPWRVTLRHLMGHLAGVRNDGGDEGPLLAEHCDRPVEALPHFASSPLLFEPGTRFHYSSYGWILVSAAVEAAANEPFFSFMRTAVLEPLALDGTRLDAVIEPAAADRATSYFPRFAADPRYGLHLMRPVDHSCYAGAAAFVSTPSDLVRFGLAVNAGRLLRPATVRLLQTPQRLASGEETGYGLGWKLDTAVLAGERVRIAGHDGLLLGGTAASLLTLPERRIAVAVISNISYADTATLAARLAEAFLEAAGTPADRS